VIKNATQLKVVLRS